MFWILVFYFCFSTLKIELFCSNLSCQSFLFCFEILIELFRSNSSCQSFKLSINICNISLSSLFLLLRLLTLHNTNHNFAKKSGIKKGIKKQESSQLNDKPVISRLLVQYGYIFLVPTFSYIFFIGHFLYWIPLVSEYFFYCIFMLLALKNDYYIYCSLYFTIKRVITNYIFHFFCYDKATLTFATRRLVCMF